MSNPSIMILILTILGLCLFEIISSLDNAIINAEVLGTMSEKSRKWFLFWGILFAVFAVRGLLPWLIVWATAPSIGPVGAFMATFSNDPQIAAAIQTSAPILLVGGGMFLLFLFLHWLFLEKKNFTFVGEQFIHSKGIWFYAIVSIILCVVIWASINHNPVMALGAAIGSSAFFITDGFKQNAEKAEKELLKGNLSDISKIFYLEILDATFSIDGVLGAFAFTMSVPLILLGNGVGAFVVREITISNIERIKKYKYLKNGAMYSVAVLGAIMILHSFGVHIPDYVAPVSTFIFIGYFFYRSRKELAKLELK